MYSDQHNEPDTTQQLHVALLFGFRKPNAFSNNDLGFPLSLNSAQIPPPSS
jgi:3-methyladenine DNA glycosylase/8-oxoguanine DNA glycosylase